MRSNLDVARLFLRKARSDLADVRRTLASEGPYDTALFHCQQAVEKYLKALLAANNVTFPKIHDVVELAELCADFCPTLGELPFELAEFNPFAVTIRYDDVDDTVSLDLAKEMFDKCNQVLSVITAALPEEIKP